MTYPFSEKPWIVTLEGGRWLQCLSCGMTSGVPFPIELDHWLSVANEFVARHWSCPSRPENWRKQLSSAAGGKA